MIATRPHFGERKQAGSAKQGNRDCIMQKLRQTTRERLGPPRKRPPNISGLGVLLALSLAAIPSPAEAWTPWGAIARLFSRGDSVRQGDGAVALRAVCLQANDHALKTLATQRGFTSNSSAWLDIAPVFAGSASLAMAFGGGDTSRVLEAELARAAEAAMPSVHDVLAGEIAQYDYGDPLAVLRSGPGAASHMLSVHWQGAVTALFRERMETDLGNSAAWARTEAALDRIGPGKISRSTLRALLDNAAEAATDAVFQTMREHEILLRGDPNLVESPRARGVLRRVPAMVGKEG